MFKTILVKKNVIFGRDEQLLVRSHVRITSQLFILPLRARGPTAVSQKAKSRILAGNLPTTNPATD